MIDDYPDFKFAPRAVAQSIPTVYSREPIFTAFNLIGFALFFAAGWVLGNTHPEVAIGFVVIAALVLVVRGLLARSES